MTPFTLALLIVMLVVLGGVTTLRYLFPTKKS